MYVYGQEFNDEVMARIAATVEQEPAISRRALSRLVCGWLDWRAPNGSLKDMSCRLALLRLHGKGLIPMPEPAGKDLFIRKSPEQQPDIPKGIEEITGSLEELGCIEIIPIEIGNKNASRTWNALMEKFHYLGAGPLCGSQMRYLIRSSSCGWLGGLAFSSSAWRVAARDRWIGWSEEARKKNLSKVICNSRFLLVPNVPNLASYVLSRVVHRIKDDWNARYAIELALIETYVNQERFKEPVIKPPIGITSARPREEAEWTGLTLNVEKSKISMRSPLPDTFVRSSVPS